MTVNRLLSSWRTDPSIADNIVVWQKLEARRAQTQPFPVELHPELERALKSKGYSSLYSHQASSWKLVREGKNVVVVTGTASGKTLCYNLPVINALLADPGARALYLFPTRALAQDQLANLAALLDSMPLDGRALISPAVYDGDTARTHRPAIRQKSRLVITNPDMLHTGILPHHTGWAEFFQNLRFIVMDEMHAYRGVFGSHVANVLRRLRRITQHYGSDPRFILTSATIANPSELAEKLIEQPVALIDNDGSTRGAQNFLIYNPPVINKELGLRRSALQEGVRLATDLLAYQIQTIIFGRSRRTVELTLTYLREGSARESLNPRGSSLDHLGEQPIIRGYRSGYLPAQRRNIEQGLRQGDVRAVVATNALELGIDIGAMGAALLVGYPGTIASTWQQAGRAGRGEEASLAVLIATADPVDQYLARHPDYLFGHPPENGLINPNNLLILLDHLRCAAFELPFQDNELFGSVAMNEVKELLDILTQSGVLHHSGKKYFWMADQYPAQAVSLRSASTGNVLLQVETEDNLHTIGEIDPSSAHWMAHPGAIYLHEGQTYLIEALDLEKNLALLHDTNTDYYTEPRLETQVELIDTIATEPSRGATKSYGDLRVRSQLIGFHKLRWYTHEKLGYEEISLPPSELVTTGYWLSLEERTVEQLRDLGLWKSDPNEYGPAWRKQRDLARARDAYRCQVCGAPESDRAHDVHHKVPFRSFRDERGQIDMELANRLENLMTLCPSCHHRVETAVRIHSGLAGLAYTLSQLAPLFLMCDTSDIGVHSDPVSPIANGQPVVILYDKIPAGIGFSQRLFELHDEILRRAYELVSTCDCEDGCPSCVGPGGENGSGGKKETLAILEVLAGVL
jgi:DEAD/DEAH box helicase domain-containing protein